MGTWAREGETEIGHRTYYAFMILDVVNIVLVGALVWITKKYADQTAAMARSTAEAAAAASRSAAAAEELILMSVRPELVMPSAVNFNCRNEQSVKGQGFRDVLAPFRFQSEIRNLGAGHAFSVRVTAEVAGFGFTMSGAQGARVICRDAHTTVRGELPAADVDQLYGLDHLKFRVSLTYRDATGAWWCKTCDFEGNEDVTSARLRRETLKRLATPPSWT